MPKTEMQQSRGLHVTKYTFMLHNIILSLNIWPIIEILIFSRLKFKWNKGVISLNLILIFLEILLLLLKCISILKKKKCFSNLITLWFEHLNDLYSRLKDISVSMANSTLVRWAFDKTCYLCGRQFPFAKSFNTHNSILNVCRQEYKNAEVRFVVWTKAQAIKSPADEAKWGFWVSRQTNA